MHQATVWSALPKARAHTGGFNLSTPPCLLTNQEADVVGPHSPRLSGHSLPSCREITPEYNRPTKCGPSLILYAWAQFYVYVLTPIYIYLRPIWEDWFCFRTVTMLSDLSPFVESPPNSGAAQLAEKAYCWMSATFLVINTLSEWRKTQVKKAEVPKDKIFFYSAYSLLLTGGQINKSSNYVMVEILCREGDILYILY